MSATYLAIDFGGGSGRVMAASIHNGSPVLEEVYRFTNRQVDIGGYIFWDFPALWADMKEGIRRAALRYDDIRSIGIDTWGVDFGLIDSNGILLGNPICYRDNHVDSIPQEYFSSHSVEEYYSTQGIQVMAINTIFRLMSMQRNNDPRIACADKLLFMPDLFSYYLTGVANCEYTEASTSGLLDATTRDWNRVLIRELGLPESIFPEIVMPGTSRGNVLPHVCTELGLPKDVKVIAVGSHDTASAVFAAPRSDEGIVSAFLSSGTWSLLGIVLDEPVLTEKARLSGFSNEGGVGGRILFLQNITGLWILQRLVESWKKRGLVSDYPSLVDMAETSSIDSILQVDDPVFSTHSDMESVISRYCLERGLSVPQSQGEFVLCVLQSLAARYAEGVDRLNAVLPSKIQRLNIIGGGSNNRLLNRLTEQACGIPVEAGPSEATAIGNVLVQIRVDTDSGC